MTTTDYTIEDAWEETIDHLRGAAAKQRYLGGRNAAARADVKNRGALPAWVTEETAEAAVHAELCRMDPAVFEAPPTEEVRRRLFGAQAAAQAHAAGYPAAAAREDRKGEDVTHVGIEAALDLGECDPDADREAVWAAAVQRVLDAVASLPDHHRETVERLIAGDDAPIGVGRSAWKMRKTRARQAFAAAHASLTR